MATYKCDACGMSVNASCGECNIALVNGMLDLDDGTQVQISQCKEIDCSSYDGKIKSPLCCGNDMQCAI
tara:strand:+ start:434 stop:640 length:207 start_codon:yes stop_codon:yes gene_type:complete